MNGMNGMNGMKSQIMQSMMQQCLMFQQQMKRMSSHPQMMQAIQTIDQ